MKQRDLIALIILVVIVTLAIYVLLRRREPAVRKAEQRDQVLPVADDSSQPVPFASFSPSSGQVGTLLRIKSAAVPSTVSVTVGNVNAIIVSRSGNEMSVMVMPGTVTGPVMLTTDNSVMVNAGSFNVLTCGYTIPGLQQGSKLVGSSAVGAALQGVSVAISADGNTMATSGYADGSSVGAVWVFTRTNGVWTQQGGKITPSGYTGTSQFGFGWQSVSLSADGNTLAVGGLGDNSNQGAVWVFTRSGGVWTQQGSKLVGTGNVGAARQGQSTALSANGNILAFGGHTDNSNVGAFWVFTRSNGVWTQDGSKLVGSGSGSRTCGIGIAISSDGTTIMVGGQADSTNVGAAWAFTKLFGAWTQQQRITATGLTGSAPFFGTHISLSADGNIAAISASGDSTNVGAVLIFDRVSGTWSQRGAKITPSGIIGAAVARSVSLNASGCVLVIGATADNTNKGAFWTYKWTGSAWMAVSKIVNSDQATSYGFGYSTPISSDGTTLAVGGPNDPSNTNVGATWIYV